MIKFNNFKLFGQGSSSDQPEQLTTDAESLDRLMVRQMMQESGLTSGIMAEAKNDLG